MEEFPDLIQPDVLSLMKDSMYNATVGDGYRVGGFNGDNRMSLIVFGCLSTDSIYSISYLQQSVVSYCSTLCVVSLIFSRYMRVMAATYIGNMMGDCNMTHWGDVWAQEAITAFDEYSTLSEVSASSPAFFVSNQLFKFNSGTYSGVTLYALSLWGYMPANSTIASRAPIS